MGGRCNRESSRFSSIFFGCAKRCDCSGLRHWPCCWRLARWRIRLAVNFLCCGCRRHRVRWWLRAPPRAQGENLEGKGFLPGAYQGSRAAGARVHLRCILRWDGLQNLAPPICGRGSFRRIACRSRTAFLRLGSAGHFRHFGGWAHCRCGGPAACARGLRQRLCLGLLRGGRGHGDADQGKLCGLLSTVGIGGGSEVSCSSSLCHLSCSRGSARGCPQCAKDCG
mmetsp:Transcript_100091/g.238560  ORF Transcript_100091/g.238560 Transcript_100091/m.238560 type:complete len:224 (+) Transcript_100091:592-1263(+)